MADDTDRRLAERARQLETLDGLTKKFGQSLANAFTGNLAAGRQLDSVLGTLATRLSSIAARAALNPVRKGLEGVFKSLISGEGGGDLFGFSRGAAIDGGRVRPFVRGGAIESGRVWPFAHGGVVGDGQVWPFAHGGVIGGGRVWPFSRGGAIDGGRVWPFAKGGALEGSRVWPFAQGGVIGGGRVWPFAHGGVIGGSFVRPFASGGVVAAPTYFPMRGGAGLMGEAGPEAILPLRRGSDGRLGVAAKAGERPVSVTVNIATQDAESFRRSQAQVAAGLARAVARGRRAL